MEDLLKDQLDALAGAGLTLNEAKVYLALIKLNVSNVVEISRLSEVHRVNVYDSLSKLRQKGLVHTIMVNGKKKFQADDPKILSIMIQEKSSNLNRILPQLELIKRLKEMKTQVGLYEGFKALKNIYYSFLEGGEERVVYGVPRAAFENFGEFFSRYHQKRLAVKKKMRHIYNSDAKDRIKYLNKMPYTEARYLNKEFDSPVATSICGNQVVLTVWGKNPTFIVIINKKIADAYRKYFEILWKKSHKF